MAKFSIVIPLYNKANYIEAAIQSVLSQSISDFELIVVDDGSKDESAILVERIRDKRIKLIRQSNGGVSKARNVGIQNATGDYICFLDADDIWKPNFLHTVQKLIDGYPDAEMFCPSYQVSYGKRIIHPKWRSVDLKKDGIVKDFFEMATAPFWVCNSSCVVISMNKLMTMDYWFPEDSTFYEDFDLWLRVGTTCKVAHSNEICATYIRKAENNARSRHSNKIIYSNAYMNTLLFFLNDSSTTVQQKEWIREIIDRRMVVYIYSLLMTGNRKMARDVLARWRPTKIYAKYAIMLKCTSISPRWLLDFVQQMR